MEDITSICDDCPAKVTTFSWQILCVLGEDMGLKVIGDEVKATREVCGKREVLDILVDAEEVEPVRVFEEEASGWRTVKFDMRR